MDFWSNLWSFATAVGTIGLALATYAIIRQGQQQRKDAEQQHQDRFRPICSLIPWDGVDSRENRRALVKAVPPAPENPMLGKLAINCALQNVGTGPAVSMRIKFKFLNMNGWTTEPVELGPIGAGQELYPNGTRDPIVVPFRISEQFNATSFAMLDNEVWEIWLEYEDVFGNAFQTIHSRMPFNPDLATATWTDAPPGEQPKAIMQTIPWIRYQKVEPIQNEKTR